MTGIRLQTPTTPRWTQAVLAHFDAFLLDHAACERKAMSTGMLFLVRYPDREALLEPMIEFAKEELDHFHAVYRLLAKRGLRLAPDVEDPYAAGLLAEVRGGRDERLLDRLLVSAIFEARGCERFGTLAGALEDGEERTLYRDLTRADAKHQRVFLELAANYASESTIAARLEALLAAESAIVARLPVAPALYAGS